MWTLIRISGVYLGIWVLVAKAAQWLNRHCGVATFWPLVILLVILGLVYEGLKNLFK